jgi:hypothetical protein
MVEDVYCRDVYSKKRLYNVPTMMFYFKFTLTLALARRGERA